MNTSKDTAVQAQLGTPAPLSSVQNQIEKTVDPTIEAQNDLQHPEEEKKTALHDARAARAQVEEIHHNLPCVKLAVIGNVDSGKSTLVGVLSKGIQDDGRGSARLRIFNYPHEAENGRTSSVAHEIMGFDKNGKQILPDRFNQNKNKYWSEVVTKSDHLCTLIDLCGHEKYLKTTMFGLVGFIPDYSMIIVGANMGIQRMTKEHLGITLALKIPLFVVVTKIDMCPKPVFDETLDTLQKILKSNVVNRRPVLIGKDDDAMVKTCAETLPADKICPIFCVSSVTGEGMDKLVSFLSLLQTRQGMNSLIKSPKDPVEFDIHETFMVSGVGLVVSGVVKSGTIKMNQSFLLGPDKSRTFRQISVRSIHVSRVASEEATAGEYACLAIKPLNKKDSLTRDDFRKGMVIIDPVLKPHPIWDFEAEVIILHHSTTIQPGYQAVMHCGVVRQAVNLEGMTHDIMKTGDKGLCHFRFMYNPEYIKPGTTILLREGRTKILGQITSVFTDPKYNKEKDTTAADAKAAVHHHHGKPAHGPADAQKGAKGEEHKSGEKDAKHEEKQPSQVTEQDPSGKTT